jgi:hypothetical protein
MDRRRPKARCLRVKRRAAICKASFLEKRRARWQGCASSVSSCFRLIGIGMRPPGSRKIAPAAKRQTSFLGPCDLKLPHSPAHSAPRSSPQDSAQQYNETERPTQSSVPPSASQTATLSQQHYLQALSLCPLIGSSQQSRVFAGTDTV